MGRMICPGDSTGKDLSTVLGPSSGRVQENLSRPSWVRPVGQYRKRCLDRPGSVQWDSTGKDLDRPGSVQWDSTGKDLSTVLGQSSGTVQEKISRPSWVRPVGQYRKSSRPSWVRPVGQYRKRFLDRPGSV